MQKKGEREALALIERINRLKREKRAVVLVHNYQRSEIYDVADFVGDSLGLCLESRTIDCDIIIFSGVHFMAESAKILNPDKRVFVPDPGAGCALSDMITARALREKKAEYPEAAVVCYINSTAEVKAESDICCTSSNAVEVVRSLPQRQVLFVPDKNLANYVARAVPEKEIIPWDGFCPIHHRITAAHIKSACAENPGMKVIAHPECTEEVRDAADYVTSTSNMISVAQADPSESFLVVTECGMVNRMKQQIPNKRFVTTCSVCFDMKKNTLEKIEQSLLMERFEVLIPEDVRARANETFRRMFELTGIDRRPRDVRRVRELVTV